MRIVLILILFFSSSLKAEEIDAKKAYIKTLTEYLELRIKNDNSGLKNLPLTQEKVLDKQPVLISFTIDGKGFLLDSFFEKKSKQEIINDKIDRLISESSPYPSPPESLLVDGKIKIFLPLEFK
ncbi:MAG: TonB C-terminal domain-containing protein [Alphaproteobacteria bacterium]|jgi:hypothetical protein